MAQECLGILGIQCSPWRTSKRLKDEHASDQESKPLSLLTACPVGTEQYSVLDLEGTNRNLDSWTLLVYDYAGESISEVTAHQANVFPSHDSLTTPYNPAQAVSDLLDHDIAPERVILGQFRQY